MQDELPRATENSSPSSTVAGNPTELTT